MSAAHPLPADESFGQRLRRERERRQIALSSIAENSKIKVSLFEELERDDASHWPSGVFRRAFIRAYADAIGLDPEATAREFLERFPDPNDPDRLLGPQPALVSPRAPSPPPAHVPTLTAAPRAARGSSASTPRRRFA